MFLHLDCRYYLGDRPCKFERACEGCTDYQPMGPRILLIKFGALGDVVRTGALLAGLERLVGEPPHVTWLTAPGAAPLVERMAGVDRVWTYGPEARGRLQVEKFDVVINLDKEPAPCSVAMTAHTERRLGIGLSRYGTPYPLNEQAEYYFELGLNNEEKFHRNRKSYQQLIYEAVGIEYRGEHFELEPTDADRRAAAERLESFGAKKVARWIGLNPGAGGVFANKAWREEGYRNLVDEIAKLHPEVGFILLGGPDEELLLDRMIKAMGRRPVFHGGTDNSLGEFLGLIDRCDVLVCSDTLAMHLAIARRRPVVAIFGPTCEQEVDLYGLGAKIKSPIECSPCYLRDCDKRPTCQDMVTDEMVLAAVREQLAAVDPSPASSSTLPMGRS